MKEAAFYTSLPGGTVGCQLCPQRCQINLGKCGICKARENVEGVLYSRTYGQISSLAVDPIEKKPLYHFHPGSRVFSLGSFGCNFFCLFCQNWQISQQEVQTSYYSPEAIVGQALAERAPAIAYTYNEPLINYEFVKETSQAAHKAGLKNVLVSNGYINPEPLSGIIDYIDAVNLDIKAGNSSFYGAMCGGSIEPVLATAEAFAAAGVHLETTTLIIPGENDATEDLLWLAGWIAENCGRQTPVHLSAYVPRYKLDVRATSATDLFRVWDIFRRELDYVYCGNMQLGAKYSNTYCSGCGNELVSREGYSVECSGILQETDCCSKCGAELPFVM